MLDTLFAIALFTVVTAATVPRLLGAIDDFRVAGAARYVAARVADIRMQAVSRSANVAMRFVAGGNGYTFGVYVDGNRNGVLTRDISSGADPQLEAPVRLSDLFPGVDFGALPGTPPVESGSTAPGSDPIRLGGSDILAFTANGTSTSGSLYVCGKSGTQYAVRILGQTGRTRLFKYSTRTGKWAPM